MAKENQRKALVTFSRSWFSLWLSLANFGICFIFCSWWQILIVLHFHSHFYRIHPILGFWCIFWIVFVCIILLSVASNGSAAFFGSIALLESGASFHVLLNLIWFPLDILVSFGNHRMERWSISITIFSNNLFYLIVNVMVLPVWPLSKLNWRVFVTFLSFSSFNFIAPAFYSFIVIYFYSFIVSTLYHLLFIEKENGGEFFVLQKSV